MLRKLLASEGMEWMKEGEEGAIRTNGWYETRFEDESLWVYPFPVLACQELTPFENPQPHEIIICDQHTWMITDDTIQIVTAYSESCHIGLRSFLHENIGFLNNVCLGRFPSVTTLSVFSISHIPNMPILHLHFLSEWVKVPTNSIRTVKLEIRLQGDRFLSAPMEWPEMTKALEGHKMRDVLIMFRGCRFLNRWLLWHLKSMLL
jgi:hypothetical protein